MSLLRAPRWADGVPGSVGLTVHGRNSGVLHVGAGRGSQTLDGLRTAGRRSMAAGVHWWQMPWRRRGGIATAGRATVDAIGRKEDERDVM